MICQFQFVELRKLPCCCVGTKRTSWQAVREGGVFAINMMTACPFGTTEKVADFIVDFFDFDKLFFGNATIL